MEADYLQPREAARRLGISVTTLYDWLGQSDYGLLEIRGEKVTIDYLQGGAKGQGRIRILTSEVERLIEVMRVKPKYLPARRPPVRRDVFPGITVRLGRPPGT
ncbi:DNA-binding protein [Anatilimnocola sp. NA78]|uniref:DNA-binding protein n=1 Tax=Anatilimnocola sp. NA78 TaxID=3415683 RepID=UPI003CE50863